MKSGKFLSTYSCEQRLRKRNILLLELIYPLLTNRVMRFRKSSVHSNIPLKAMPGVFLIPNKDLIFSETQEHLVSLSGSGMSNSMKIEQNQQQTIQRRNLRTLTWKIDIKKKTQTKMHQLSFFCITKDAKEKHKMTLTN